MLREIRTKRQDAEGLSRRWFQDADMDLFVWCAAKLELRRFELSYDKPEAEKVLTWSSDRGFKHTEIDDGGRPGRHPASPLLVRESQCDAARLLSEFERSADDIDPTVIRFVSEKLRAFERDQPVAANVEAPAELARRPYFRYLYVVIAFVILLIVWIFINRGARQ